MLRDITPVQILLLLLVILLLFGAKRLPDLTRSIGKSMRILKTEVKGMRDEDDASSKDDEQPSPSAPKADPAPLEGRAVDEARREQRDEQQHRAS